MKHKSKKRMVLIVCLPALLVIVGILLICSVEYINVLYSGPNVSMPPAKNGKLFMRYYDDYFYYFRSRFSPVKVEIPGEKLSPAKCNFDGWLICGYDDDRRIAIVDSNGQLVTSADGKPLETLFIDLNPMSHITDKKIVFVARPEEYIAYPLYDWSVYILDIPTMKWSSHALPQKYDFVNVFNGSTPGEIIVRGHLPDKGREFEIWSLDKDDNLVEEGHVSYD